MFKHIVAFAALALTLGVAPVQAQDTPDLSQLEMAVGAAQAAGLADQLTSGDGVTVFVPTNDDLSGLPTEALAGVRGDLDKLEAVVSYHAVPGKVMAKDVMELAKDGEASVDTLGGGKLTVVVDGDTVKLKGAAGEATVTQTDIEVGNVVVHVIDGALLPEGVTADKEGR